MTENNAILTDETRSKLKALSKSLLRLHKIMLDAAKAEYEAAHGKINGTNLYLQLVIDDPHFAWLRKLSSMVALIDEGTAVRRPANQVEKEENVVRYRATQAEGDGLLNEAKILLHFEDGDEDFNDKFQAALQRNSDAVLAHNDALGALK